MRLFRIMTVAMCCAALLAGVFGCRKKDSAEPGAPAAVRTQPADSPDKVIEQAVKALKNNQPVEIFGLLPPSYQNDVQAVITEATSKMDKEIFELGVRILDMVVAILEKHGAMLAGMAAGMPFDADEAIEGVKEFHTFLKDTKLLEYDSFKNLNAAGFLAQHGAKFMTQGMSRFESMSRDEFKAFKAMRDSLGTSITDSSDDSATVVVTIDDETHTIEFSKVEGRWVPADLASDWDENLAEAKKNVSETMAKIADDKDQIKEVMEQLLAALTKVEETGDLSHLEALGQMFM